MSFRKYPQAFIFLDTFVQPLYLAHFLISHLYPTRCLYLRRELVTKCLSRCNSSLSYPVSLTLDPSLVSTCSQVLFYFPGSGRPAINTLILPKAGVCVPIPHIDLLGPWERIYSHNLPIKDNCSYCVCQLHPDEKPRASMHASQATMGDQLDFFKRN